MPKWKVSVVSNRTPINRDGWPKGEWDQEGDRHEWVHAGLACMMRRVPLGHWCGYVGVPATHPLYGADYDCDTVDTLRVHGGVNYAKSCSGDICHTPQPGMPDNVWWFGFDCAHAGDRSPGNLFLEQIRAEHLIPSPVFEFYCNQQYVTCQTELLADQLHQLDETELHLEKVGEKSK